MTRRIAVLLPLPRLALVLLFSTLPFPLLAADPAFTPADGSAVLGRKPVIEARFSRPVVPETVALVLDGMDVTAASRVSAGAVIYFPPLPVPGGLHAVTVQGAYADGQPLDLAWSFTLRHTESFDEIGAGADLTVIASSGIEKNPDLPPDWRFTVGGPLALAVKKGGKEFSFRGDAWYLAQDGGALSPAEPKGGDLRNFCLTGGVRGESAAAGISLGDLSLSETPYLAPGLARRGAQVKVERGRLLLSAYSLDASALVGVRQGVGIGFDPDSTLTGTSLFWSAEDGRTSLRAAWLGGRDRTAGGYGVGGVAQGAEGSAMGLELARGISERLTGRIEAASSRFIPEADPQPEAKAGGALKTALSWRASDAATFDAGYERVDGDFRSIGNPAGQADFTKASLGSALSLGAHSVQLALSWARDNLDGDPKRAVNTQLALDAGNRLAVSDKVTLDLQLHGDTLEAGTRPSTFATVDTRNLTATLRAGYAGSGWTAGGTAGTGRRKTASATDPGSSHLEYRLDLAFAPSDRFSASFALPQFTSDRDLVTGVTRESRLLSLTLSARPRGEGLTCDITGSLGANSASDGSQDGWNSAATLRLAYPLSRWFPEYALPTLALGGECNRIVEKSAGTGQKSWRVYLALELRSRLTY